MVNEVKKEFLVEHFRKHDFITLYKQDGTPVTFSKQRLCQKPVPITVT